MKEFQDPSLRPPSVKVELFDGTHTWVTYHPIRHPNLTSALEATAWAFTHFTKNLVLDKDSVERNLLEAFE